MQTTFKPTRVAKNADGAVVVEVELWNRLPVRVYGVIHREPGKAQQALEKQLRAQHQLTADLYKQMTKSRGYKFSLAPGEKITARFVIPKQFSADPKIFSDDDISLGQLAGLGDLATPLPANAN